MNQTIGEHNREIITEVDFLEKLGRQIDVAELAVSAISEVYGRDQIKEFLWDIKDQIVRRSEEIYKLSEKTDNRPSSLKPSEPQYSRGVSDEELRKEKVIPS